MITANTLELALQRTRQIASDETETLDFQSYDTTNGVEHIEVWAADRRTVAEWQTDDRRLRLAARDLLDALKGALQRLEINNYAGEEDAHIATVKAAIAKAEPSDG